MKDDQDMSPAEEKRRYHLRPNGLRIKPQKKRGREKGEREKTGEGAGEGGTRKEKAERKQRGTEKRKSRKRAE